VNGINQRTLSCALGFYAIKSVGQALDTRTSNLTLIGSDAFLGCDVWCGDGLIIDNDCDDGNNIDGDGCSLDCHVEPGFSCGDVTNQGKACCHLLDPSITTQLPNGTLRCYNTWWVPGPDNATTATLITVTGKPFVVNASLNLCGGFFVPSTTPMIVGQNATITLAGNLVISKNANLTFWGRDPALHGIINFTEDCGLPGYKPGSFQFSFEQNTTLNINGFDWPEKTKTDYKIFVNATQCVNVSSAALYMNWVSEIPGGSSPFPFIHDGCALAAATKNNDTGFTIFRELDPVNLPDRCSNIQSYPYTDAQGKTVIYVVINKKDLCFNQIVTMGVFIPSGLLAAAALASWYSASASTVEKFDYVTL